jgi:NADH:ubiquinone oxidoreductase subunit F (NADH-binding)
VPLTWRVLDRERVPTLCDYVDLGGGRAARAARQAPPDEVISLLSASGLRGRGGAGFPTGAKWATVAASRSEREVTTIVVNAAEGEPGTFKDRALIRTNPYRVLEGAIVAATAMRSDRIRIGIKATFGRETDRLTTAIAEMREAGWLESLDIQLVFGPSSYLFGEETALLEVIEGRQPFPRVTPPYRRGLQDEDTRSAVGSRLAAIGGGRGAPALVDNVETLANVPLIVEHGVAWFRELGTEQSPGTLVTTVTGATRRSAVAEVAMGSTLREVIDLVGWGPRPGHEVQVVLAGTANPLIPGDLLDTPLTYETMRAAGTGLGSAGFIVFDETTAPAAVAAGVLRFLSVESCGQCEPCKSDGLQIAAQLHRSLREAPTHAEIAMLRQRINTVAFGARCNLAQQQSAITSSLLDLFPDALGSNAASHAGSGIEPEVIAPIADLVCGRATLDPVQPTKRADWSYGEDSSGAAPAARLGNTPVHIAAPIHRQTWPEWVVATGTEQPLEIVSDAHAAIDALIDRALSHAEEELGTVERAVVVAVRTHVDVTRRVLFPMVRRVGDDLGDRLVDEAEAQERILLRLADDLDHAGSTTTLRDIGVAMHDHAIVGDKILELLREALDPEERASLADGLAAAQATSTVARLRRGGLTAASPAPSTVAARSPINVPPAATASTPAADRAPADDPRRPVGTAASAPRAETPPGPGRRTHHPRRSGRLLVGLDGSPASFAALAWSTRLADRIGAEVVTVNVFEPDQAELSPGDRRALIGEADDRLREWSERIGESGVPHRRLQLSGPPDVLLAAASSEAATLLVVGTRGAGRRATLHLGSLAHHLAHQTRGPLAIVPAAGAATDVDRIVIGIDGSAGSSSAATWCAGVAAAADAKVHAVCATRRHLLRVVKDDERWREVAEAAIRDKWIAPLRAADVAVRTTVVDGVRPLDALEAAAAQDGAGLVVVGTRGLSEIGGVRLGRLPLQLVHHTHLPVVLVPPAARS